jgi:uncharacterized protein (TIGR02145 family)
VNFSGKFGQDQTIWYPASGCRYYYDGSLAKVGNAGFFWSASPNVDYNAYYLLFKFEDYVVKPSTKSTRADGLSVRCVKE